MEKTLAAALLLSVFITSAVAHDGGHSTQPVQEQGQQNVQQELSSLQDAVNGIDAPGFINSLVGKQRVQLHLNTSAPENFPDDFSGQQDLSVTADGLHIQNIQTGEVDNPTVEIWADQNDLEEIAAADNTVKTLRDKVKSGAIDHNVYGLLNRVRFGIAKVLFSLFA